MNDAATSAGAARTLVPERALVASVFLSGVLFATELVESPFTRPAASGVFSLVAVAALAGAAHVARRAGAARNRSTAPQWPGSVALGVLLFFGMGGLGRLLLLIDPQGFPQARWGACAAAAVAAMLSVALWQRASRSGARH